MHYLLPIILYSIFPNALTAYFQGCDQYGINFYEGLGCNATQTDPSTNCPMSYQCPEYKMGLGYCMAGGKRFEMGQQINNLPSCSRCNCGQYSGGSEQFACAQYRCGPQTPKPGCYLKTALGSCCPGSEFCPDGNTYKCVVDGKTYTEHQRINPKDTCWECTCSKGFQLFKEPFCRRRPCGLELRKFNELIDNCTPVYSKDDKERALCCPSGFICPKNVTLITRVGFSKPDPSGITCSLGTLQIPLQEQVSVKFTYEDVPQNANCTCQVAPHPTCIYT